VKDASPDRVAEIVRAYACCHLRTLGDGDRERWAERFAILARELGSPEPLTHSVPGLVWRVTMASLRRVRYALQDGPEWLAARYGAEERRMVDEYVERHLAVLRAVVSRALE
jgi:hypothetical protein